MALERRNQAALLAALLVILVAVVWYQFRQPPSSTAGPASNGRGTGQRPSHSPSSTTEAPVVHLPALAEERPKPVAGERNLFRFKPKAPPPPAPPPPQPPVPPVVAEPT